MKPYQIINNNMYRASVAGHLLHCLSKAEGKELLLKIHASICGGHMGSRALTSKVLGKVSTGLR
jgi:hypothetical protein